ncbi:MAG: DUF4394 domain-containing protein [Phycisphaerae bacterium]|nr:DUF4394 domain-containing protein [Phycisphaerae bacterium]
MKIALSLTAAALALGASPTAQAELVYGITGGSAGGSLVSFDSATPGTVTTVGSLSGVLSGHAVRAIDFRPATGQLYALSHNGAAGQVYTVNLTSGALTTVGAGFSFAASPSSRISMDFNPVVDRIRIVTGDTQNLRVHPGTGALVLNDTALAYDAGDANAGAPAFVVGAAYTNNFAGATSTSLYAYDFNLDNLVTIGNIGGAPNSPNTGKMFSVGLSGLVTSDGGVGMDISRTSATAYLSYNDGGERFGTLNLATGAVTSVGAVPLDLLDISVVIPAPSTFGLAGVVGLGALGRRRR